LAGPLIVEPLIRDTIDLKKKNAGHGHTLELIIKSIECKLKCCEVRQLTHPGCVLQIKWKENIRIFTDFTQIALLLATLWNTCTNKKIHQYETLIEKSEHRLVFI